MTSPTRIVQHNPSQVHVLEHPLASYKLALMRDPNCSTNKFRALAKEIGIFLTYEATRNVDYRMHELLPDGDPITNRKYVVISILRSGLAVAEGALEIIPSALIGHFSFRRIENNEVERHLIALPTPANAFYIILDTVIGTGSTADLAVRILKDIETEERDIALCMLLAAQVGIDRVLKYHKGINIYTASIEQGLNRRGHVVPGFGSDENDKMFGIR